MKKKKQIIIAASLLTVFAVLLTVFFGIKSNHGIREIKIHPNAQIFSNFRTPFDLNAIITGHDGNVDTVVFRGIVKDLHEYSVTWEDDNGEENGGINESIIEVQIEEFYKGILDTNKPVIKILYPYSLSGIESNSVNICKDSEYIFVNCWIINEKYHDYAMRVSGSVAKDPLLAKTDCILGGAWCSLFPVDNDIVFCYNEYFSLQMQDEQFPLLEPDKCHTSFLTNDSALTSGDYIALKYSDFHQLFREVLSEYK